MRTPITPLLVALVLPLALTACKSAGTRPTDMTAPEHRAAADVQRDEAAKDAAKYDPDALATQFVDSPTGTGTNVVDSNPTERYKIAAEQHQRLARAHEKAAAALEAFEGEACKDIKPAARAACPLLGPVKDVKDILGGARVELIYPGEADALAARIQCHIAFANVHGTAGLESCPLYMKGVTVTVKNGELIFKTRSGDEVKHLRELLREHIMK